MKKIIEMMEVAKFKVMAEARNMVEEEKGDFGIKQLAIVVGVIVIVGFVIGLLQAGLLETWIGQVWDFLFNTIQGMVGA